MTMLKWDTEGTRLYETGVDRGVLYPMASGVYGTGVAWSGLIGVSENPSGAEETPIYSDNIKYGGLMSNENFAGTIEAYTYPDEWAECDGSKELAKGVAVTQQERKPFGLAYRTKIGNDTDGIEHGYKLHLIYGAKASPSQKQNKTIGDSPEAMTMSWEFKTTPVEVPGMKPSAHIVLDSTKVEKEAMKKIEDALYGASGTAKLPTPTELKTLVGSLPASASTVK